MDFLIKPGSQTDSETKQTAIQTTGSAKLLNLGDANAKSRKERKLARKRIIRANELHKSGDDPTRYFLHQSDEDKDNGQTPNWKKFSFYNGLSLRVCKLMDKRSDERLDDLLEIFDAKAGQFYSEACSKW